MDPAIVDYFGLKIDSKDVFIIDTPNFDGEEQSDHVAKIINGFISHYKFEIICILYSFRDPSEAFNKNGDSLYEILH